jgi:hypothetical protein
MAHALNRTDGGLPHSIPPYAGTQVVKRDERSCSMHLPGIYCDALREGHNIEVLPRTALMQNDVDAGLSYERVMKRRTCFA